MKLTKILGVVACVGLLSAGVISSGHHAYAQDDDEIDENAGSWSTPGGNSADEVASSPDSKKPPLNVDGCWDGTAIDDNPALGGGIVLFNGFDQSGKKLLSASNFAFSFAGGTFLAMGHLKGTVSNTGITFKGSAGPDCPVSGSATGSDTAMTGKFKFGKKCAHNFKSGTFAIHDFCA
jgi:hypothetical protein